MLISIATLSALAAQGKITMRELGDHPVTQFVVLGLAVMAFFIAVKAGAAYLPDSSVFGAVKKVVGLA